MPTRTTDDQTTHTFRAATLEEAVALAEQSLGSRVTLVAANRIRRGGLGGFFAADLGVEVVVSPIEETVESALERLISSSSNEERARWEADHKDSTAAVAAALAAVVAGDSSPSEGTGRTWLRRRAAATDEITRTDSSWYSPPTSDHDRGNRPERLARLAELDRVFGVVPVDGVDAATDQPEATAPFIDRDPTGRLEIPVDLRVEHPADPAELLLRLPARAVPPTSVPSPSPASQSPASPSSASPSSASTAGSSSLARVERIIEELQVLTSTPRLLAAMGSGRDRRAIGAPANQPTAPSMDASVDPADGSQEWKPVGQRPAPGMIQRPTWPTTTRAAEAVSPPAVSLATPRAISTVTAHATPDAPARDDRPGAIAAGTEPGAAAPSELTQRQVELAVSAADALLGSLRREDGVKRLSVRVILRTGDHDEVAAEAEWDAGE